MTHNEKVWSLFKRLISSYAQRYDDPFFMGSEIEYSLEKGNDLVKKLYEDVENVVNRFEELSGEARRTKDKKEADNADR